MLKILDYAKPHVIDKQYFTASIKTGSLAGRVRLPLGATKAFHPKADEHGPLKVPDGAGGHKPSEEFFGRVTFVFPITVVPRPAGLDFGNVLALPNSDGVIKVRFANVRPSQLAQRQSINVEQDAHLEHLDTYYSLLDGSCSNPKDCWILAGKPITDGISDKPEPPGGCKVQSVDIGVRWIDPIQCTIADGCEGSCT